MIQTNTYRPAIHRATQKGVEEVTQRLEFLEGRKDLARLTGKSSPDTDRLLRDARADLAKAKKPAREFSDETRQQVRDYLKGVGPLPAEPEPDLLEKFARLASRGVQFTEGGYPPPLPSDEAFLKLVALEYHAAEEQIGIMTQRDAGLQIVTLRPEYLASVEFFLDKTLAGETFYKPDRDAGGHVRIEHVSDFLFAYKDRPEEALVAFAGGYVSLAERGDRLEEMEQFLADTRQAPVPIEDLGDAVVVGGIILDKEQGW